MKRLFILFAILFCCGRVVAATDTQDTPPTAVMVLPFRSVDEKSDAELSWIPAALDETFKSDLANKKLLRVIDRPESSEEIKDDKAAAEAARSAGADVVILGTYQKIESDLRLTGRLIDVKSGEAIGGLKATGATRDFFSLADSLTRQAIRKLLPAPEPEITAKPADPAPQAHEGVLGVRRAPRERRVLAEVDDDRRLGGEEGRRGAYRYRYQSDFVPYYYGGYYNSGVGSYYGSSVGYYGAPYHFGHYDHLHYPQYCPPTRVNIRVTRSPDAWSVIGRDQTAGRGNVSGAMRLTLRAPKDR